MMSEVLAHVAPVMVLLVSISLVVLTLRMRG